MNKTKIMIRLKKVGVAGLIGLIAGALVMALMEISKYSVGVYTAIALWVILCLGIQSARQFLARWKDGGTLRKPVLKITKGGIFAIVSAVVVILTQLKQVLPSSGAWVSSSLIAINIVLALLKNGLALWKESGTIPAPAPETPETTPQETPPVQ